VPGFALAVAPVLAVAAGPAAAAGEEGSGPIAVRNWPAAPPVEP